MQNNCNLCLKAVIFNKCMKKANNKMTSEQLQQWLSIRKKCIVFEDKKKKVPRKAKHKKSLNFQ